MKKLVLAVATVCLLASPSASLARSQNHANQITHVVWVIMENKLPSVVVGRPSAPYITHLARTYGYATDYVSIAHPSAPNYVALTSGGIHGVTRDDNPFTQLPPLPLTYALRVPSIFSELPHGRSRSLLESMTTNCQRKDQFPYAARHNPMLYYVNEQQDCQKYDVPLNVSNPNLTASFTFIAPNLVNDQHDGTIQDGDHFLRRFVPALTRSRQYRSGSTVVFITWDESGPYLPTDMRVPLIVISPYTHRVIDHGYMDHYTLLKTTELLLGVPQLAAAKTAPLMPAAFGFWFS